jgi:hypothetical protein
MAAYNDLVSFVADQGLSEGEAEHAIRRCLMAMAKYGIGAYAGAGAVAYFMNMTPASAVGFGLLTVGGGAAVGLMKSPQCSEVRGAVRFWNTANF